MLKIGIIGCGVIGFEICRAIEQGIVTADLIGVCDVDFSKAETLLKSFVRERQS